MTTKNPLRAALSATVLDLKHVALRSATAFSSVTVDEENSAIMGAAVMTIGPAIGHGFEIDSTTLQQVASLINAKANGAPVRFRHPDENGNDTLGSDVGYVRNARIEGNCVRGDVFLADYSEVLPQLGNVKQYLMRKAKSDPGGFGLSAVIGFDLLEKKDGQGNVTGMLARVSELDAVDFVGKPAANPNGLLAAASIALPAPCSMTVEVNGRSITYTGATPEDVAALSKINKPAEGNVPAASLQQQPAPNGAAKKGLSNMDKKIRDCLSAHFGLAADADEATAQALYNEKKTAVDAKMAEMSAKPVDTGVQIAALAASTHEAMLAAEGKRVVMLTQLAESLRLDAKDPSDKHVVDLAIAKGDDVPAARLRYLKRLEDKCKPVDGLGISVGDDRNRASLATALPQAMLWKMGVNTIYAFDRNGRLQRDNSGKPVIEKIHERTAELASYRVRDILREYLSSIGIDEREVMRLDDARMTKLFTHRGLQELFPQKAMLAQGVDDFDAVLANVQNKALRIAYVEMPATWQMWCGRRTTPDFKTISDVQMSESPDLQAKDEHGRYRRVQVSDSKETWSLGEYGIIIAFTRRALLNDDLNAFSTVPQKEAAAARRLEEVKAYQVLTNNSNMVSDSTALFASGHSNLDTATANVGAPAIATLALGRKALRLQTGPKGAILNLIPKYLIVPAALETAAEQYTSSAYQATVQTVINPFATTGRTPLIPIVQPRLDATSATAWYLAADPMQIDTVKLCFLESEPEPALDRNTDFHTDDLELKVRHSVAATALDYRGLYKNNGA